MTRDTNVSMHDDSDEMQEVIEVQILPQVSECVVLFGRGNYRWSTTACGRTSWSRGSGIDHQVVIDLTVPRPLVASLF
jgi:hypothetical protein